MSNWSIVVTAKAPTEMINIFLEHHLKLNPKEIFIYLDAPHDFTQEDHFISNDKIKIFKCDQQFWEDRDHYHILRHKKGQRPDSVEYRQYHNMLDAHAKSEADWLLMMDIDELVYTKKVIADILSKYPENVFSVRSAPIEAVYKDTPPKTIAEVFATPYFKSRRQFDYQYWDVIYPNKNLRHKSGFFGHISGKSFLRTKDEILAPSCHLSSPVDKDLTHGIDCEEIYIQHFEAMTPKLFAEKNFKRMTNEFHVPFLEKGSKDRIEYISQQFLEKGFVCFDNIYNEMHVFSPTVMDKAVKDGFVIDILETSESEKEKLLVTHHGTILCVDIEENIVKAVNLENLKNNNFIPINFNYTFKNDSICQKGYVYYEVDNLPIYLYVDRFNQIRCSKNKKAQLLGFQRQAKNRFSLTLGDKSLRANPNGAVKMDADKISTWEQFCYMDSVQ